MNIDTSREAQIAARAQLIEAMRNQKERPADGYFKTAEGSYCIQGLAVVEMNKVFPGLFEWEDDITYYGEHTMVPVVRIGEEEHYYFREGSKRVRAWLGLSGYMMNSLVDNNNKGAGWGQLIKELERAPFHGGKP